MKKLLLSLCLITTIALAGNDTGAGGIGVSINKNTIYLYDFVEAGIEDSVYIDTQISDEMNAGQVVKANLLTSKATQDLVVAKLNEIYRLSPTYALSLLQVIKDYQWRLVRPVINSTNDIGRTPINVSLDHLQIALRDDVQKVVTIDKQNLDKMPSSHQAGLYFHEMIYAQTGAYDSYRARLLTSFLFHPSFQFASFEQLEKRIKLSLGNGIIHYDYSTYMIQNSDDFKKKCNSFRDLTKKQTHTAISTLDAVQKEILIEFSKAGRGNQDAYISHGVYIGLGNVKTFKFQNERFTVIDSGVYPVNIYRSSSSIFSSTKHAYSIPSKKQKEIQTIKSQAFATLNTNRTSYFGSCIDTDFEDAINYLSNVTLLQN